MKDTSICPKCECKEIITDAKAIDRGHGNSHYDLSVATFEHPEALLFKGIRESTISAYVCSRCGYVEFYADDLKKLKEVGF
jgi:predicted nucleic-acid-binding Zn-ribbon protein